jgi:hypothetical protein
MITRDRHGGERTGARTVALAEKFDLPFFRWFGRFVGGWATSFRTLGNIFVRALVQINGEACFTRRPAAALDSWRSTFWADGSRRRHLQPIARRDGLFLHLRLKPSSAKSHPSERRYAFGRNSSKSRTRRFSTTDIGHERRPLQ